MTETYLNLNNFNDFEALLSLFPASKDYEFTAKKIFRSKKRVICCEQECWHDGHDFIRKKRFGKVKIGKQKKSLQLSGSKRISFLKMPEKGWR